MDKEIELLKRQVAIKDAYCKLIIKYKEIIEDCKTKKELKELIDVMVGLAQRSIDSDDKTVMFGNEKREILNILKEKIGDAKNVNKEH